MSEDSVIDWQQVLKDAKAGNAWPEGDYDFEVVECDAVTATTGAPMLKTKLRCLTGTYAGKHIMNNFVLSLDNPGALAIFFRHMAAFGLDESFFAGLGKGDLRPLSSVLRGEHRRATITIGHRTWNGVAQNDVKAVRPYSGGQALGGSVPVSSEQNAASVPPPPQFGGGPIPQPPTAEQSPPPPPPPPAPSVETAPPPANVPPPPPPPPAPSVETAPPPANVPPPPAPPAAPVPAAPPTTTTQDATPAPPPGYEAIWATMPDAAKQAVLAQVGSAQPV
jgi:hypothetical protein